MCCRYIAAIFYLSFFTLFGGAAHAVEAASFSAPLMEEPQHKNAYVGFVDFHGRGEVDANNRAEDMSVAYYRWTWAQLEPEEGRYNFELIDRALSLAIKRKQTLSFRIMPVWQTSTPKWLLQKGVDFVNVDDGQSSVFPDHNNPIFIDYHARLLSALSARYGNNKFIQYLDIGSAGCWGEWHASCCKGEKRAICEGFFPNKQTQIRIIDDYFKYFGGRGLIGLIASPLEYVVQKGGGWRADCLGDYGFFSSKSNHMDHVYAPAAQRPIVKDAWQNAPVIFETCFSMKQWVERGFDVERIFGQAISWHASLINDFSRPVPDGLVQTVDSFRNKLGYDYRIISVGLDYSKSTPLELPVNIMLENIGNAPPYRPVNLSFRLVRDGDPRFSKYSERYESKKILPGEKSELKAVLKLDSGFDSGDFFLDMCIDFGGPYGECGYVSNSGRLNDGWYRLKLVRFD